MRVALVPSSYSPRFGGVEELTGRLARALTARGHETEVWVPIADEDGEWTGGVEDGVRVRRHPMPLWPLSPTNVLAAPLRFTRAFRALLAATREFKPDLLHVQCFSTNGAYATALSAATRTPLVITLQGETFMDDQRIYERSVQLRWALRWGVRRAEAISACSQYTLDDAARRFGAKPEKSRVIFNGVDIDESIDPVAKQPYVLGLGRAVRNKGFDLAIRAFACIADRHPQHRLVIAGDGPAIPELRSLAAELSLEERIDLRGGVDRAEVGRLIGAAELMVVPSRVEPFGIVVLEAWRGGCPVLATAHGGIPEFASDNIDAVLVDPTDTAAFSFELDRLLGDEPLRRALGQHGAVRVRDFDWRQIVLGYERLYERAGVTLR